MSLINVDNEEDEGYETLEMIVKRRKNLSKVYIRNHPETWYDKFLVIVCKFYNIPKQKELTDLIRSCVEKRKNYLSVNHHFKMNGKDKSCSKRFLVIKLFTREINLQDLRDYLKDKNA